MAMQKSHLSLMEAAAALLKDGVFSNELHLRLFVNTPSLSPTMVTADFEEPTDTGYPPGGILLSGISDVVTGLTCAHLQWDTVTFVFDLSSSSFDVKGMWVYDATATIWRFGEYFDAPVTINVAGQPLSLIPRYEVGNLTVPCT